MSGNSVTYTAIALVLAAFAIIGYFIYRPPTAPSVISTFQLTPKPSIPIAKAPEPIVSSWTTYTNTQYNFTLSVPAGWNQQEYHPQLGGLQVAFSPGILPCPTCTYVHDGYLSIYIYNQKTDPQSYTAFTTGMQSVGQSKLYQGVLLDNIKGFLYGNLVAVENHGWVYQLVLDENNGNNQVLDSKIFQKVASSLNFTYLIFNQ